MEPADHSVDEETIMERAKRIVTNTALLTAVRVIVPLMSLGVVLAISRILGAEGLGRYTLVFTVLYVINTIAPLGLYGLITREGARAREHIPAILGSALLLSACATIPMTLVMNEVGDWLGYDPETVEALRVLSVAVAPFVVVMLSEAAFVAIEKVQWVAVGAVIDNSIKVGGAVVALINGQGLVGVIFWTVVGKTVCALFMLVQLRREGYGVAMPERAMVRRLAGAAPTFLMIQIFATIYWRIDVLMLSKLGNDVVDVGLYGAAYRIFELVMIVPQSLCLALYPQIVQASRASSGELHRIGRETLRYLAAAILPAAVGASLLGGQILELLYGAPFVDATSTLSVLIWAIVPFAWVRYHAYVLVAVDRQRIDLLLNVVMSGVNVALNFVLIPRYGHLGAAVATLVSIASYSVCQFAYLRSRLPEHLAVMPHDFAPLLAAAVMAVCIVVLHDAPVLVTLAVAAVVYLGVLLRAGFFAGLEVIFPLSAVLPRPLARLLR